MNKVYYSFGNPFKVKFRRHYCYNCGTKLLIVKHHKIVSQKSPEAKYYSFDGGSDDGVMVGPCLFIHKVFYCPKCLENIEFDTQISLEDIDNMVKALECYFQKKAMPIAIKKSYERQDGIMERRLSQIKQVKNLSLSIEKNSNEVLNYKMPISRKKIWERPYYFKKSKYKLKKFLKAYL